VRLEKKLLLVYLNVYISF